MESSNKNNKKQRTKNNTQPASSRRAQELLGEKTPTLIGFLPLGNLGNTLLPTSITNSNNSSNCQTTSILSSILNTNCTITPQYQVIFKKFTKKDPLSRRKALHEFMELVEVSELDDIKSVLVLWPNLYMNLANDDDAHVRELTQLSLQLLITKCQKHVAPYLKQLAPVWLNSQYDFHIPAAKIATKCFNETFTNKAPNRSRDVCLHCQHEIMDYINRNLIKITPQFLVKISNVDIIEAEKTFERMVVCSLKSFNYFLQQLNNCDDNQITCEPFQILNENVFWNFLNNKSVYIKAALLEVMNTLLKDYSDKLDSHKQRLILYAFNNITESNPVLVSHLWNMILFLQNTYKNWYEYVDFHKSVWPKVITLLRKKFNRNADLICPKFLTFITNIVQCVKLFPDTLFYNNWVKNFFCEYLLVLKIEDSEVKYVRDDDLIVILKTYFDCLRFFIQRTIHNVSIDLNDLIHNNYNLNLDNLTEVGIDDNLLFRILFEKHLLTTLKWLFSHSNDQLAITGFDQISYMIAFYFKHCNNVPLYSKLLNLILNDVKNYMEDIFTVNVNQYPAIEIKRLTQFIKVMYTTFDINSNYSDMCDSLTDNSGESKDIDTNQRIDKSKIKESTEIYFCDLKNITIQLLRFCINNGKNCDQIYCMENVCALTNLFKDKCIYANLTDKGNLVDTFDCLLYFLKNKKAVDEKQIDLLIELIFVVLLLDPIFLNPSTFERLMEHSPNNEVKHKILNYLTDSSLFDGKFNDTRARDFRQKLFPQITKYIVNLHSEVTDEKESIWNIKERGVVEPNFVEKILVMLDINQGSAHQIHSDINQLFFIIGEVFNEMCKDNHPSAKDIEFGFPQLFFVMCQVYIYNILQPQTIDIIDQAWKKGITSGKVVMDDKCLKNCANSIEKCIQTIYQAQLLETDFDYMLCIKTFSNFIVEFIKFSQPYVVKNEDDECKSLENMINALVIIEDNEFTILYDAASYIESIKYDLIPFNGFKDNYCEFNKFTLVWDHILVKIHVYDSILFDYIYNQDSNLPIKDVIIEHSNNVLDEFIEYLQIAAATNTLLNSSIEWDAYVKDLSKILVHKINLLIKKICTFSTKLKDTLIETVCAHTDTACCRALFYLLFETQDKSIDNCVIIFQELQNNFVKHNNMKAYIILLQYFQEKFPSHQMPVLKSLPDDNDIWMKASLYRSILRNNYENAFNTLDDKYIVEATKEFLVTCYDNNKESLAHQCVIFDLNFTNILNAVEQMKLLRVTITQMPDELSKKHWEILCISLANWLLSVSKSLDQALLKRNFTTFYFMKHVIRLFHALERCFDVMKPSSSSESKEAFEEWKSVFAKDVHLTLFTVVHSVAQYANITKSFKIYWSLFLYELPQYLEHIDYNRVYLFYHDSQTSCLNELMCSTLMSLTSFVHAVRGLNYYLFRKLAPWYIHNDLATLMNETELMSKVKENQLHGLEEEQKWHFLHNIEFICVHFDDLIKKYLSDFDYKQNDIITMCAIETNDAIPYFILWDCIIFVCGKAPHTLRPIYTRWLSNNRFENFLHFVFRAMPIEVLENHNKKYVNCKNYFKSLSVDQISDSKISVQSYACHMYLEVLYHLPALVRRWWSSCHSRKKNFIDALTANYVSPIICKRELSNISENIKNIEHLNIKVNGLTREIIVHYAIEGVQIELIILLHNNHPLRVVKVESQKQVKQRSPIKNIAMQLTLFLTLQNSSIYDSLILWKSSLDKKFEGVEECYICFSVIHQEICNLPKISCGTCKKKFHGPCLYKWFSTSNKSTCPLCRNVF